MSKNIAIVANSTWNIYNFRLNVLTKLIQENWSVTVVAPIDEYIEYKELYPTVKHIPLKSLVRDSTNPVGELKLIAELRKIYKELQPDLSCTIRISRIFSEASLQSWPECLA